MACQRLLHQFGRKPVLEQTREFSLAYEQCLFWDCPLIVYVIRTARMGHGRVIIDRNLAVRHFFPHFIPEYRCLFSIKIGFEKMSHSLMNEDSAVSWSQNNGHFPGRRQFCFQKEQGFLCGILANFFRSEFLFKIFQANSSSSSRVAGLSFVLFFRHRQADKFH